MADEWVQAKNLVRQQVEIMVNELEEQARRISNQRASIDVLQKERDAAVARMNDLPTMRMQYENSELRRQVRDLTELNERYRDYMRLKDNAKIKVEQKRDYLRTLLSEKGAQIGAMTDEIGQWRARVEELEAQNARQAKEFQEAQKTIAKRDDMIRQQSAENGRLLDVIKLGRKGIEGEGRDWELRARDYYVR